MTAPPADPAEVRVVSLHLAPAKKAPTEAVESVLARAGEGLVGDRYLGTRHRHVSVQSATALEAAAADLGVAVPHGSTRRNVTISHGEVPTRPGARLRIGPVLLEVVRVAAPCPVMDTTVAPGARAALRRRGGSVLRILEGGTIRIGDPVDLLPTTVRPCPPPTSPAASSTRRSTGSSPS